MKLNQVAQKRSPPPQVTHSVSPPKTFPAALTPGILRLSVSVSPEWRQYKLMTRSPDTGVAADPAADAFLCRAELVSSLVSLWCNVNLLSVSAQGCNIFCRR